MFTVDIQASAKATIKYLQTQETQLARFNNFAVLGNGLVVDSLGSENMHYLLWADREEEPVLNVQGILAEAYIPPIASSKVKPLSKAYQSMKIISLDDDKQFTGMLRAIDNIRVFMSRHFTPMDKAVYSNTVGDMPAIHAENQLLSLAFFCLDHHLEPSKEMDAGGVLKAIIQEGNHILTEDNVVIFNKWTKDEADNIVSTGMHPGTLRAEDLINMGISFRIVHYSSKGHIQANVACFKWTHSIKTGMFFSEHALQPHTVPVALNTMKMKSTKVEDYNTNRWICDAHKKTYKEALGRGSVHYANDPDVVIELFFCPLQQICDDKEYGNCKNPNILSLIELEDTWYGNMLVMKTVKGVVMDLEPNVKEMKSIMDTLTQFCLTYTANWKEHKSGANYDLIKLNLDVYQRVVAIERPIHLSVDIQA
ncbi:uncharacterized protein ARMOST_20344 [Armillaria ostoyae]|uniref:Uncharacterized protein n=1 Tax=Armillaria ostoyae TaxID=47428 RepID=A0A284S735_ARMOS|nr:uncharacterized protein ARMOST_20344 [Armillaria ostoyae]